MFFGRVRRRARHAAPPSPEWRSAAVALGAALLGVGGGMCIDPTIPIRAAGASAAVLGALMFTSLLWGFPLHSLHTRGEGTRERKHKLSRLLSASADRMEYVGSMDGKPNARWTLKQCEQRANDTYWLIDRALGPAIADEYSSVRGDGCGGVAGIQSDLLAKANHVRQLVARLDRLTIMEDWEP